MFNSFIKEVVSGNWINPDTGTTQSFLPLRNVEIDTKLTNRAQQLLQQLELGTNPAVVCDENTFRAQGEAIHQQINESSLIVLPNGVKPTKEQAESISQMTDENDTLIAVGSGTINDLCKYSAFIKKKPYIIWGTAPSMNGFFSATASLYNESGVKQSFAADLPVAGFFDTDVLANAPLRLIQAGLGDSICRTTAQADGMLSHFLLGTKFQQAPFQLTAKEENIILTQGQKLFEKNPIAIERLTRILLLSGLGMTIAGNSAPASQGEHLIAHYMEMQGYDQPFHYHGEQIAVTTIYMSYLQQEILSLQTLQLKSLPINREHFVKILGLKKAQSCLELYNPKNFSIQNLNIINDYLKQHWLGVKKEIQKIAVPTSILISCLNDARMDIYPEQFGWSSKNFSEACIHAPFTRDRFTFLDVKLSTGN